MRRQCEKVKDILYGLSCFLLATVPTYTSAQDSYSPYTAQNYPANVYFGDTHVHTNLSVDAYITGNKHVGPEEAYRFAKGEIVQASNGMQTRLPRPLDFLVVADHAVYMGMMNGLERGDVKLYQSNIGKRYGLQLKEINRTAKIDSVKAKALSMNLLRELQSTPVDQDVDDSYRQSVWKQAIAIADKHNVPGKFTALIGYEWTQQSLNMHRVVIFKDSADKAGSIIPFSAQNSNNPEDLWQFMEHYQKKTGGEILAIPHSGDGTIGTLFAPENGKGELLSAQYAKTRSHWEPLYEVTQNMSDSETHPLLSPEDEFADYGTLNLLTKKVKSSSVYSSWIKKNQAEGDPNWQHQYQYARSGLKQGLAHTARVGVNPFKFGLIGSTDTHKGLSTADDSNFWGKTSEPSPDRLNRIGSKGEGTASGYAAVWATENTREALFAAMKRKETYATTGPRMTVRFFGGWEFEQNDAYRPDLARVGYAGGVPMGGDLTLAPTDKAPNFLIRAVKAPDGANLDRVQIIKGWRSSDGELHEKIYNVALSDNRKEKPSGNVKPVGNTVDIADASYTNTIGDVELATVWTDPDFKADEHAFYYVRVLEIPTPRWTAYDAKYFNIKTIPDDVAMVTQERAYTSPIWYVPDQ